MRQLEQYCLIVGVARLELVRGRRRASTPAREPDGVAATPVRVRVDRRRPVAASPARGWPRPPSTTWPGPPGAAGPRSTGSSPGARTACCGAVVDTEVSRFFSALAVRMGAATDLEDVLVAGMTEAATRVSRAPAPSATCWRTSPRSSCPQLAFARMDRSWR